MKKGFLRLIIVTATLAIFACVWCGTAFAMPFYGLNPKKLGLRSQFFTSYSKSIDERKHNIALAAKAIDGAFVDINGEFSFNRTVGARTENRGYKNAKIIKDGKFVDGVGGGVCQVSTTLYNALLLAGLDITEYHPHSLPVSYVAPSFDAMVNSGSADLKFVNNTDNPIIIHAVADGSKLTIKIIGEPLQVLYERISNVVGNVDPPEPEILIDGEGEYPDLYEGETRVISYGKSGLKSEGFLVARKNGVIVSSKKIRSDTYKPLRGVIVEGRAERVEDYPPCDDVQKEEDSDIVEDESERGIMPLPLI